METTAEIDAAEVGYEPDEPNDDGYGYGDDALAGPDETGYEYDEATEAALSEQEEAVGAKLGLDGGDVAEALVSGPEPELFEDDAGNTYGVDDEGDYVPIDPETGEVVGDWYVDGETGQVGEFEGAEPEFFTDDEGTVYAEDEEGDFIPIDPETGEEVGDYFIDGETGEVGEYEEDDFEGDPRVDGILEHLAAREDEERAAELNAWIEDNPVANEPQVKRALVERVIDLAQGAGDPGLAADPSYLDAALAAVLKERATASGYSAEQARKQGAPLETNAGAVRGTSPSYEDQAWDEIKRAGGTAFST
jgi:hypothetical protein